MKVLDKIFETMRSCAKAYADLPMLARTHGQSASPTTLGKEFNVFASRLSRQLKALREYRILVKCNGASGNYNALSVALGNIPEDLQYFPLVLEDNDLSSFEMNFLTTQIEPHDTYAELFAILQRINTIFIDFCCDVWRYVSDGWLKQRTVDGEAGSSTMPHKVNPIDFENAEGNLGIANALLEFFGRKLPVSRLQRDLSDSTVMRNFGVAFAHCLIAYGSIERGMGKILPDETKILAVLDEHVEVITEAYQTILRGIGFPQGYDALRVLTRGKEVTPEILRAFVNGLNIPHDVKQRMLAITPQNYTGIAKDLALLEV